MPRHLRLRLAFSVSPSRFVASRKPRVFSNDCRCGSATARCVGASLALTSSVRLLANPDCLVWRALGILEPPPTVQEKRPHVLAERLGAPAQA